MSRIDSPTLYRDMYRELRKMFRKVLHELRTAFPDNPECDLFSKNEEGR